MLRRNLWDGLRRIASLQEEAAERARLEHTPPPAPFPGPPEPSREAGFEAARRTYEALLGTRVSVWLGALLLAFGGVFLVKYSLEQGVLGPMARVLMGLLFGAGLLAAGEFLRRRDPVEAVAPGEPNIPALLTGVGALSVFGSVYAAHGLYGFIGPATALILLGLVGIGTMALSLLHGPALAGLGLVGALVVPLLVTSRQPNPWSVAIYVPIVAAAAHAFAWEKAWHRLALAASGGILLWTILLLASDPDRAATATLGLIGIGLGLWSFFIRPGTAQTDGELRFQEDGLVSSQIGLVLVALAFAGTAMNLWVWVAFASLTVALPLGVSRLRPDLQRWSIPASVAVVVLTLVWPTPGYRLIAAWGTLYDTAHALWSVAAAVIIALLSWEDVRSARDLPARWGRIVATTLAVLPPLALLILFVRLTGGATSVWAGLGALAAALAYLPVLRDLDRRLAAAPDADHRLVTGAVLAAILACVSLAAFFLFRGVGLTVVLALMTAGTARIAMAYRAPVLRWAVPVFAVLTILRIALDPFLVGYGLGTTPIFNGLLVIYGIPALAFAYAGYVLGGPEDVEDLPVVIMQSFALLISAALVALEIRHLTHGGRVIDAGYGFVEAGLDASAMAVGTILLFRLAALSTGQGYRSAAQGLGWVTLGIAGVGLGFALNPVLAQDSISGTVVFNDLLAGYALPAVMLLALVRLLTRHPEPELLLGTRVVALWLAFLTVSLWIRFAFLGPHLGIWYGASQAELYTYSAVWLALGIAFLAYGLRFASWPARAAGFLLLFGTAGKVFLVDMAGLSGFYRAASFIGLGGVLILVGLFYQRVVVPRMATAGEPS